MKLLTRRHAVALGVAAPFIATRAEAQAAWPSKPVRFIVPFPPGQAADIFARLMAEKLTDVWKQQVVVENKGGGGGIPGVEAGKLAAPDGYIVGSLVDDNGQVVPIRMRPDVANEMTRNMLKTARTASAC